MYIRPISIPSTSLSATARSTLFAVSLIVFVADLRTTNEVENARGAKLVYVATRGTVLVRKDIVIDLFGVGRC